jgi:hypothetical protein
VRLASSAATGGGGGEGVVADEAGVVAIWIGRRGE